MAGHSGACAGAAELAVGESTRLLASTALPSHRCLEHAVMTRARSANSIRDRGQRLAEVRMYGCNLYPARCHEPRAWQTAGVHAGGRATGVTRLPARSDRAIRDRRRDGRIRAGYAWCLPAIHGSPYSSAADVVLKWPPVLAASRFEIPRMRGGRAGRAQSADPFQSNADCPRRRPEPQRHSPHGPRIYVQSQRARTHAPATQRSVSRRASRPNACPPGRGQRRRSSRSPRAAGTGLSGRTA